MSSLLKSGGGGAYNFPKFGTIDGTGALNYGDSTKGEIDREGVEGFISRELEIDFQAAREESLAKAAVSPVRWLEERKDEMAIIKKKVADHFARKMIHYEAYNYSVEKANAHAAASANRYYLEELAELEDRNPGMSTIAAGAAHRAAYRDGKFDLAMNGADRKIIYKEERTRRKAKKSRKAAKAISQ